MDIEEFVSRFNDIIPYKFQLKVGGARANAITVNKELISYKNRKGKVYPFYTNNLLGTTTDYIPLEEMDVPIQLTIECSYPHNLMWEKRDQSTNKQRTHFQVRLLSEENNKQLGFLSLDLTPAGDIDHKFCSFYNEDGTREILQSVFYQYNEQTKQVISSEHLSYIFFNFESGLEEKVEFYKEDGVLKGITINKQGLKNHAFDSIVWSDGELKEKQELFSRYCNNAKVEYSTTLACDMTNYIINKDFTNKLERIKQNQRILSYENDPNYWNYYDYDRIRKETEELSNPDNDIFSGFYGEYIGNTVIKKDSKLILVIETLKDDYHYFTQVDITNTDAFEIDFYHEREDGTSYYQAIITSDKKPMFRLKYKDEEEILVPLEEQITEDEIKNFEAFKSYCLQSFATIESKKLSVLSSNKFLNSEQNGHQLVKSRNNNKLKR